MNSTSPADLERLLREAMRPGPGDLAVAPSFAAEVVARATQTRRRRRAVYSVAVPLLAAAVAAAIVVVVTREADTDTAPIEKPIEKPVDGEISLSRWLENRTLDPPFGDESKPAAAGTSMYRICDGEDECAVTLVSPSGREIDLADVSPALAEQLAEDGLDGAALSPTGHWLGVPRDGAYWIYHLERPSLIVEVPDSPDGDRWELVGWSEQSWSPTLARYDGDRIVRFANWRWGLESSQVKYLDVPEDVVTTPILGRTPRTGMTPVANPVDPVDGVMPRVATTTPPTDEWLSLGRPAEVVNTSNWEEGYNGQSFESCVGPDETLAAPDGHFYQWEVRGSRPVHADAITEASLVFSRDPSSAEPVAVVIWDCAPREASTGSPVWERGLHDGGRVDLPTSTEAETWTFLGMLPDGEVALTRTVDGQRTYVRLTQGGQLDPMYELPADAEVITPGGVAGD